MDKQEIIKEIKKGSPIGKRILEIELEYYLDLFKLNSESISPPTSKEMGIRNARTI